MISWLLFPPGLKRKLEGEQAGGWDGIVVETWLWPPASDNVLRGHAREAVLVGWGVESAESG